jgi:putative ABC transport system permease protein
MQGLLAELPYALRRLRATPGFTLVALATLALGIGANTALFSVLHAVLLRALPFEEPERLYLVWSRHTSTDRYPFQLPEFCDYRDRSRTLTTLAGYANWNPNLTGDGPAERVNGLRVSASFFEMLGARAAAGRLLASADDTPGSEKVVTLSHGLWQRRFGGDPGVVGRSLLLNGEAFTIVGVLERSFLFPVNNIDVAVPLAPEKDPARHNREGTSFIRALGRARPGVSQTQVAEELDAIARQLQQEFPKSYERKKGALVRPYREELTSNFSQALWVLMAAVALLLLIACANLANLMLVRASERRHEMAIRHALGASRARLARQQLVESVLLAAAGASLGILLAQASVPALLALSPTNMPRAREVSLSLPVLLFALAATALAGLGFGLVPALRAARADPNADLKAEGRGGAGSRERSRARGRIVAGQVALMMVLLAGAGHLLRSFREVMRIRPGFDGDALVLRLSLPRKDYATLESVSRFYRQLEARVAALPGVLSVAASNPIRMNGALASADYKVADRPPASESELPTAQYRMVTPAFFRTLGIPLLAGRGFDETDAASSPLVAVISEGLARKSFPDRDPLGRQLLVKDTPTGFRAMEIVGVAGDVKHTSFEGEAEPHLYVPYHQVNPNLLGFLTNNQFLLVRAASSPRALGDAARRELQAVDPNVASAHVASACS